MKNFFNRADNTLQMYFLETAALDMNHRFQGGGNEKARNKKRNKPKDGFETTSLGFRSSIRSHDVHPDTLLQSETIDRSYSAH
jgi:hypothetical protein